MAASDDIATATAGWWESLIAACHSCFANAVSGSGALPEWGGALLAVLQAARRSGVVDVAEVLKRRTVVKAALLRECLNGFGTANDLYVELLQDLTDVEGSPAHVNAEVARLEAGMDISGVRVARLQSIRQVVREAARIRDLVTDDGLAHELDAWGQALRIQGAV
ncbi:hypothetical protein ACIRVF_14190 [Kitasatospora sp. NPDC101157]|uniref:hypothetical protein n=1 Tax=Kitasatospora sp. NPDC101157 TaxID=3364098 RepID=UPI0037F77447